MTEYDYSPEAYDRFMANQRRVSDWVHNSESNSRRYVDALNDAPSVHSSSDSGSPFSSSRHTSSTARPPNSRSFTTPHPHASYNPRPRGFRPEQGGHHPRGRTYHRSPSPSSPYTSSSSSTHRPPSPSRTRPRSHTHHHSYPTHDSSLSSSTTPSPSPHHRSPHRAHGNPVRAYSHPVPYQAPFPGPGPGPGPYPAYHPAPIPAAPAYKMFDPRTGREMPIPVHNVGPGQVMIPGARRGQTYLVLPPNCRVNVPEQPSRHSSHSKHHSQSHHQQPLLKRLFGSIVGSRSSHSGSRHSHSRRSSY